MCEIQESKEVDCAVDLHASILQSTLFSNIILILIDMIRHNVIRTLGYGLGM